MVTGEEILHPDGHKVRFKTAEIAWSFLHGLERASLPHPLYDTNFKPQYRTEESV